MAHFWVSRRVSQEGRVSGSSSSPTPPSNLLYYECRATRAPNPASSSHANPMRVAMLGAASQLNKSGTTGGGEAGELYWRHFLTTPKVQRSTDSAGRRWSPITSAGPRD